VIKLTKKDSNDGAIEIHVEGRLDAVGKAELAALVATCGPIRVVTLDLGGLRSVDSEGRECLIGLRQAGCHLRGGSLYINRLIEEVQS
jgi:anti-anti-sigma regulatory factor